MKRDKKFRRFQWLKHRDKSRVVMQKYVDEADPCTSEDDRVFCFCGGPCKGNPRKWMGE